MTLTTEMSERGHTFARLLAQGFVLSCRHAGLHAVLHPDSGTNGGKLHNATMSGGELTLVGALNRLPFVFVDNTVVHPVIFSHV